MSKHEPNRLLTASKQAAALTERGFRETDMQYNIGRLEGQSRRGFDLVQPITKDRLYITEAGSEVAETIVSELTDPHSLLELEDRQTDYAIYKVPRGTRPLIKTLRAGPYQRSYMQLLGLRTYRLLNTLSLLDEQAFGVDVDSIALTHNGDDTEDDVYLTLVPPLTAPTDEKIGEEGLEAYLKEYKSLKKAGGFVLANALEQITKEITDPDSGEALTRHFDLSSILRYFSPSVGESHATG